jgi:hypothetical protein
VSHRQRNRVPQTYEQESLNKTKNNSSSNGCADVNDHAAAAEKSLEQKYLEEAGLDAKTAELLARTKPASLITEAIAFVRGRAKEPKARLANPPGLIVAVIGDPERYGLTEENGVWKRPATKQLSGETTAERQARLEKLATDRAAAVEQSRAAAEARKQIGRLSDHFKAC